MSDNSEEFEKEFYSWLDDGTFPDSKFLDQIPADAEEKVADELLIHGLLSEMAMRGHSHEERRINSVLDEVYDKQGEGNLVPMKKYGTWVGALAACLLLFLWLFSGSGENLMADSLDRVISASLEPLTRTYSISVLEEAHSSSRPNKGQQEDLDGAILVVGGKDQYVFTRRLESGYTRISGCDGRESWAMREDGPVHVSTDLNRFIGNVPGRRESSSFVNLPVFLRQLKESFHVEKIDCSKEAEEVLAFRFERKSQSKIGAQLIELWVDPSSLLILRLRLSGMPQARGGPRSIELQLVETSPFVQSFFSHDHHHEPEREVRTSKKQQ